MAADDKKDVLILGRIGADDRLDPQSADQPAGEDVHAETRPRERNVDQEVLVSGTGEAAEQGHEDDGTDLDVKTDDAANPDAEPGIDTETPLILAVQHILSLSGIAFSAGAVRDLPELTSETFDPTSAVSALRHVGFEANYGEMPVSTLEAGHCPAIAFAQNGAAVVIAEITEDGIAKVLHFQGEEEPLVEELPAAELSEHLQPFFILARKVHSASKPKGKNDWFWGSLAQGRGLYGQVILAAALTNFLGLSTSLFIMVVYDRVVPNEAIESLIALTIGVLIALGFDFIIKTLRAQFVDKAGKRADARMSRLIFDKILSMKLDSRRQKSGAMATIVREFDTLREFFTSATLIAIVDLPFIFFFIWVISLIAGPLALVPLIAVPLVLAAGLGIQPFLARITQGSMQSNMSKQSVLVETLNGLETVQATGSGRLMRRRFEEASDAQSDLGLKSRMLSNFAINSAASVQQLAQIATIFYGVFLIQDGTITMGAMIAAVILGGRTLAPLSQLASAMSRANGAREAYRSLSAVMNPAEGEVEDVRARLSRPHLAGNVELKGVSYTFPGANSPILNNLSLKIPAGQKVAILGRMGSGKSTMSRLISGLIEPSEGAVLIDGVDLRQIDKSDVRRNIGVMLQETWLFSGSVKENLQMGFYEYDDAHILNIAKVSGVDDFVASHPQGYDLELRERGEGLSGGQRQSINLARALLHNPNLLILDEPTSSMDTATEKAVIGRLKDWAGDRTLIMVTHRNTLLELADRVLVMDQGTVVADTTPDKLRAQAR
ncbi:MAG: type 1 adhesin secretion system ATPase component LapB [Roseibaca calidilacus]|uniref:ATP-binding cassette, subfamily C, LapB n=1 Tax=Roseibaca calidilacus TaxID=1666912 RepID=A0A0P7WSU4_9RHOB|nr:MAG: type 1 adhesin secretion system ATPase component LapB [Roseibaca calidilacus]CUX80729.1 ATP-binding cassette, subfamily C, LapB [Roseibaca calidilacus]